MVFIQGNSHLKKHKKKGNRSPIVPSLIFSLGFLCLFSAKAAFYVVEIIRVYNFVFQFFSISTILQALLPLVAFYSVIFRGLSSALTKSLRPELGPQSTTFTYHVCKPWGSDWTSPSLGPLLHKMGIMGVPDVGCS